MVFRLVCLLFQAENEGFSVVWKVKIKGAKIEKKGGEAYVK